MLQKPQQFKDSLKTNKLFEKNKHIDTSRIRWLVNNYEDDVWKLVPHIQTDEKSKYTVTWDLYDMSNYVGVFDRWDYWKNCAKELAYWMIEAPDNRCNTTSTLVVFCRSIREFYEWLCFERKCFSLKEVTKNDIQSFIDSISTRNLTFGTVVYKLTVISSIYSLRKFLSESFSFNPFKINKINTLAKAYSVQNGHTPTLFPKEIFSLLNHALKLVNESAQTLELFHKYMEIHSDPNVHHRSMYLQFFKVTGVRSSELQIKVRALYGAAVTIILILLAERKHELSLTKESDVLAILNNELDVLIGLEMKTAGTITGKKTERPVIQEVKDALLIILELTKYTREKSSHDSILLKLPFSHSANGIGEKNYYLSTLSLYVILESFAKSASFNRIKIRPHMFRRAYAMLWTWRYEIGDLEELSLMLKHNSLEFTQKYTDDENIWKFIGKTEQDLAFDILNRAFQEKIVVAGKMGETLERYARIIQAKSQFLDPVAIADFVDEIIVSNGMRVVAHSDGYCFISYTSIEKALCRSDGIGLDPIKRKDSLCMTCPNFAMDNSRKEHWEKRIELHQQVVDSSKNEILIESSKGFILKAKKMLNVIDYSNK